MIEKIQLGSVQELNGMNIPIQAYIHHTLELTQENAPKQDTIVVTDKII